MGEYYMIKKSTVKWTACIVVIMMAVAALVKYAWVYVQVVFLKLVLVFFIALFIAFLTYVVVQHGKKH